MYIRVLCYELLRSDIFPFCSKTINWNVTRFSQNDNNS